MTAKPDTTTARPEVAAAISIASIVVAPLPTFLALTLEVEQRVVDADGHADQQHELATVPESGTRYDSGAYRPSAVRTEVNASSTGIAGGDQGAEGDQHDQERDRQAPHLA